MIFVIFCGIDDVFVVLKFSVYNPDAAAARLPPAPPTGGIAAPGAQSLEGGAYGSSLSGATQVPAMTDATMEEPAAKRQRVDDGPGADEAAATFAEENPGT